MPPWCASRIVAMRRLTICWATFRVTSGSSGALARPTIAASCSVKSSVRSRTKRDDSQRDSKTSIVALWSWPPRSSARITSPSAMASRPWTDGPDDDRVARHRRGQRAPSASALQPARSRLQHAPDLEPLPDAAHADERPRELRRGARRRILVLVVSAGLLEAQAMKALRRPHARGQPRRISDEETESNRPVLLLEQRRLVGDRQQVLERLGIGQGPPVGIARSRVRQRPRALASARARTRRADRGRRASSQSSDQVGPRLSFLTGVL